LIKYNYEVSVNENRAKLNKDIFLFRGNRNIHYYFSIKGARFTFSKENEDLLESSNAIYAAVTVVKPNGVEVANAIAPVEDGLIHLKVTEDLIDEEVEVGDFDLVFDLFDDNEGAVTIPKIKGQFHVQERPCTTSIGILSGNVNVVNQAVVDLAIATQENEQLIVVDDDGKYVKTTWAKGDKISVERLNKMEEGIYNNSSRLKNIGTGGSTNASDITITDVNDNFESANVEGALNELGTQYKDIANNFTTEQTTNSYKIKYGTKIIAEIPLSSTTPLVTYTITNKLTNATSSNDTNSITKGSSYTATITPSDGYIIDVITVTMDGNDVTSNVVHENAITINNVIGNIVITATASQHPTTNPLTNLIADIQPTDYYLDKTDSLYKISDRINNVTIIVYTLQPELNPLKTFPGGDFANNLTKIGTTFQGNTGGVSFIYEKPNSSAGEITKSQKLNKMVRFLNEFKNNTWNNYTSQANGIPYINTSGTSTTYNSESYYKTHENIKSTTGEWDRCIMTISLESNGEIKTYLNDELSNTIPAPADFKNWDYVAMSDTWNKLELIEHKVNILVDNNYQITCIIRKGATSIKDIQNYYKYKTSQSLSLESNVSALNLEEGDNFFSNLA
jgi:hypothetical protein